MSRAADPPADDPTREHVDHERGVDKAPPGRDVREVGDPQLIGSRRDELAVDDLPGAWAEKYRHYLGIEPANDAEGVLQDIHWSAGLIGYFPTYTLGNLYAAQLFESAERDLGGLAKPHARGEFRPLGEWLQEHVHQQGQRRTAAELVCHITGKPLSHVPLVEHLSEKFGPLYGLS